LYLVKTPYLIKKYFSKFVWDVPQSPHSIFLTFDDGPTPGVTEFVLKELDKYQAKASFFCIGERAKKHPELFEQIKTQGHIVANHTYSHLNGKKTSKEEYLNSFKKCEEVFSSKLFRPPYGKITKAQHEEVLKTHQIIMWDVLSGDFDQNISKEKCWKNVRENTNGGSIIVFHDSEKAKEKLLYTLPKTLEYFSNKGFVFKSLQ
jgi:peptidoglycan/xylan/chitin deacetylase (PgdA/CDA1 family)